MAEKTKDDLIKELEIRGTAEVTNGIVNQVTQTIDETETKVKFLQFGEMKTQSIIPIDEACAKCGVWKRIGKTIKECQEIQRKEGQARGFNILVCPKQLVGQK